MREIKPNYLDFVATNVSMPSDPMDMLRLRALKRHCILGRSKGWMVAVWEGAGVGNTWL